MGSGALSPLMLVQVKTLELAVLMIGMPSDRAKVLLWMGVVLKS